MKNPSSLKIDQPTFGEYRLRLQRDQLEKIADVPGLRVDDHRAEAFGTIDAIDAAAIRLGEVGILAQATSSDVAGGLSHLRPYQRDGINWLVRQLSHDGAVLLADDMGLGKTLQAITTAQVLRTRTHLVICPGSVRETWRAQIKKWAGVDALVLETGKDAFDEKVLHSNWVVTSYELASKLHGSYLADMMIIDEAHLVKGRWAKRSKRVEELAALSSYRIAMTGTPMWSRPRDFWMLLKILFRYRFGSAEEFDFVYCGAQINQWGGRENKGASRSDELRRRLSYVMLRREKRDVAKDLPPLTRTVEWMSSEPEAKRKFETALLRRQAGDTSEALKATLKGKMDRAIELAQEAKRFLLCTWMKEHARFLHLKLNELGTPCVLITGDLSQAARQMLIGQARAQDLGIVATTDSISTGVDGLQHCANIGIMHALDYVGNKMAQLEARLDRIGQQLPVQWVYLAMRDSMDALVVETVVEKLDQWRNLMGASSNKGLRDALGDHIDGAGQEEHDKAALRALFGES